ncbi:MAG: hypothetical protein LBV54_05215 [Puniceicoccales bacterium]|jgi:hypothetical protein|nr:hypothetical protein [Puniceicoccales bacterium]
MFETNKQLCQSTSANGNLNAVGKAGKTGFNFVFANTLRALLVLLFAVAGSAMNLSAQNIAGTWYFTGYATETDATVPEVKATNSITRTEANATFTNQGSGTFSVSISGKTITFPLSQKGAIPHWEGVSTTPNSDGTGTNTTAQLFRADDNTFLFSVQKAVVVPAPAGTSNAGSYFGISNITVKSAECLVGVLTKTALPSRNDAKWVGDYIRTGIGFGFANSYYDEDGGDFGRRGFSITKTEGAHLWITESEPEIYNEEQDAWYPEYPDDAGESDSYDVQEAFDGKFLVWHGSSEDGDANIVGEEITFQLSDGKFADVQTQFGANTWFFVEMSAHIFVPINYNPGGNNGSGNSNGNTPLAPEIVTPPQAPAEAIWVGESVTLEVAAEGNGLSYQWFFKGKKISNAIGATYIIPNATVKNSGDYYVEIKNAGGTVQSTPVTLTVNAIAKPKISVKPLAKVTTALGEAFSLSVGIVENPTPGLSYQWFLNGTAIPNANTATYTVSASTSAHIGKYTVEIANNAGKVKSAASVVSAVIPPANAVSADAANANELVALQAKGVKLTAKLAAGSAKPVGYQWVRVNADGTETELTDKDATKATYTAKVSGLYKVRLLLDPSDRRKFVDGIIARVKIIIPPNAKVLTIAADKPSAAASESLVLTASLNADVSADELLFTWYVNSKPVATTTVPTYTVQQETKATTFAVQVTNGIAAKKIVGKAKSKALKIALAAGN